MSGWLQSKATGFLLIVLLCASLGGAGYQWFSDESGPELEEIPQPNMEAAERITREHVGEALAAARRTGDAAGYGRLGQIYHSYSYLEAAAACYRNAIALDPADYRWPHLLSAALADDGEAEAALAAGEQALAALRKSSGADPVESRAIRYHLGALYLRSGDPARAEALLAALSAADDTGAAWFALGQVAAQVERSDAAVEAYRQAAERAPKSRPVLSALGAELRRVGREDEGRTYLARARDANPSPPLMVDPMRGATTALNQSATSLNRRASAAARAGNDARALNLYRRAVEVEPKHPTARVNLAVTMERLGRRHQAIAELEQALKDHPDSAVAHLATGRLKAKAGRLEESLEHLERSLRLNPDNATAALWQSAATGHARGLEAGLRKYESALERFPGNEGLSRGKARLLASAGRYREAAALLSAYLETAPECLGCRHYLARLLAASPDVAVRNGRRALELARDLVAVNRDLARTETLAMALAEAGDFAAAQREQQRALRQVRRAKRDDLIARVDGRLALYRAGRPCREPWDSTETYPAGIRVP